jgi:hypothetical protein
MVSHLHYLCNVVAVVGLLTLCVCGHAQHGSCGRFADLVGVTQQLWQGCQLHVHVGMHGCNVAAAASDGKVQFSPVLGLFLLNPELDWRFGLGNIPEP